MMKKQIFPDKFPKSEIIRLLNQAVEISGGKVQSNINNMIGIKVKIYSEFLDEPLVYEFQTEKTLSDFAQNCGIYLLSKTNLAYKIERIFTDNDNEGQILEVEC